VRNILHLFFRAEGLNPWTVVGCLIAASVVEGIGFVSLVPLLSIVTDLSDVEPSPLVQFSRDVVTRLGLPLDVRTLLAFFVGTLVLRSALTFAAMRHVGYAVASFSTGLRERLIGNLFRARWSYLVQHRVGRVAAAISGQSERAGRAYFMAASFFAVSIQTAGYLLVAFIVSWPLALAAIGMGGVMVSLLHFLVRIARKAGMRQTQRTKELVTFLVDTLNNVKPLRAMAKQGAFANLLNHKTASLNKSLRRQVVSEEGLRSGNEVLAAIFLGTGFFVAISIWQVPIVELAVVGLLLKRTTNGIGKIQQLFQKAIAVESAYGEVQELITAMAAAPEPNPGRLQAMFERGCSLDEVSYAHGAKPVLHAVSVRVPVGQVVLLTGPSGAGKTTIADIILGLYQPQEGRVCLDDVPLQEIDLESWRRLVGYVPQELVLFHDSIFANVSLGDKQIGESEVRRSLELAGAWEFVRSLPDGLKTVVGEGGAKLSGGQRQRIAIARALVAQPKLLILDEVTSALDPETERQICHNIRSLAGQTTILAITHRPAFVEIADVVYRVYDGQVVEQAKSAPLTAAS
jgi:ATP-binding cassette subfamily C protein